MDGERRASNEALLLKLADTVARIDERGDARDRENVRRDREVQELKADVKGLRSEVQALTGALSALVAEINAAKTVAKVGGGLLGHIFKLLPYGATAAGSAWLTALWGKH